MKTIVENLFTNWHLMRWLRLGFGIFLAVQSVQYHDALAGIVAAFFLFQVVTNTGCCGSTGCPMPSSRLPERPQEAEYEEIKSQEN